MTHDQPHTVDDFLAVRHQLAETENTSKLEELDDQLHHLITTNPDQAATIMAALSVSGDLGAKNAAAIYVKYLFPPRPDHAREILRTLLNDNDTETRNKARDTLDKITSDPTLTPTQAAHLTTQITQKTN